MVIANPAAVPATRYSAAGLCAAAESAEGWVSRRSRVSGGLNQQKSQLMARLPPRGWWAARRQEDRAEAVEER